MKKIIPLFTISLALMAATAFAKSPLEGTWQAAKATNPKPTLVFKADGTYTLDGNSDGQAEISGKYIVKPDRQVVFSEKGQQAGLYIYEADGPALRLMLDTDPNDARKNMLSKTWVRKPF